SMFKTSKCVELCFFSLIASLSSASVHGAVNHFLEGKAKPPFPYPPALGVSPIATSQNMTTSGLLSCQHLSYICATPFHLRRIKRMCVTAQVSLSDIIDMLVADLDICVFFSNKIPMVDLS